MITNCKLTKVVIKLVEEMLVVDHIDYNRKDGSLKNNYAEVGVAILKSINSTAFSIFNKGGLL